MSRRPFIGMLCLLAWLPPAINAPADMVSSDLPDAGAVIRRLIERAGLTHTNEHARAVVYYRTNITEEYNGHGEIRERREMVKRIIHHHSGERSAQLVLYNGRTPTEAELREENEEHERRRTGNDHKDVPDRSRQINHFVTSAMLSRFVFEVVGREEIENRPCLMVTFRPAPDQEPPEKIFDRVINRMGGIIWVDEADDEMVKADIQLRERVRLWGGFLASLDRISLKILRTRLEDGFWIDREVEARFTGRALTRHIDVLTWDFASGPIPMDSGESPTPMIGNVTKPGIDSVAD